VLVVVSEPARVSHLRSVRRHGVRTIEAWPENGALASNAAAFVEHDGSSAVLYARRSVSAVGMVQELGKSAERGDERCFRFGGRTFRPKRFKRTDERTAGAARTEREPSVKRAEVAR